MASMKKIYVMNGYPRSGKTLFGELVGRELAERGINFLHTSSIEPVKVILQPIDRWGPEFRINLPTLNQLIFLKSQVTDDDWSGREEDKTPEWRRKMSDLKQKITDFDPSLINETVFNKITQSLKDPYVAFVDIREPDHIKRFLDYVQDQDPRIETEKVVLENGMSVRENNTSDESIEETKYDIRIQNPRHVFRDDAYAYSYLKAVARTFVENEVLEKSSKERFY